MENEAIVDSEEGKKNRVQGRRVWLLPFYIFILQFVFGVVRSAGILYVAIIEAEQFTRQEASWPGSFRGAVTIIFSPVVGMLSARWSPHQMALCGISLFVVGYCACYFSTNLYVLIIFYGILRGCGMTMSALMLPVLINTFFKENRALAMGLGGTGRSVAGFVWPYLIQFLLETYALNGTFFLLGGASMHGFIAAFGFLAFNIHSKTYRDRTGKQPDENTPILCKQSKPSYRSCVHQKEQTEGNRVSEEDDNQKEKLLSRPEHEVSSATRRTVDNCSSEPKTDNVSKTEKEKPPYFNPRIIKNIFTCRGFYLLLVTRVVTAYFLISYSDLHIDYLKDKGIPVVDSAHMIVVLSSGDIVGKLVLSWISDKKYLSRQFQTACHYLVSGGVVLLFTFTNSYPVLLTCAFVLGLAQGSSRAVSNVMIADYMRTDEMILAFGFIRSINGAFAIGRAPVIGYFRDILGTYDYLFRILSGGLILTSLMWMVEGFVVLGKKKHRKRDRSTAEPTEEG